MVEILERERKQREQESYRRRGVLLRRVLCKTPVIVLDNCHKNRIITASAPFGCAYRVEQHILNLEPCDPMTTQERYINPFTDFGFKKIFGSEVNKDLLIAFLNSLLPDDAGIIADLSFMPTEQTGRSEYDRRAIFDLHCKNEHGDSFIVEMQRAKQNYFKDRSVFYASFPIQQQAKKGTWDFRLKPVYMVGILDFIFDEDQASRDVVHHEVKLLDRSTGQVFYNKLTFIYLELPKFRKSVDELVTDFEKWCYLLRHLPELTDRPQRLQEKVFSKVFEIAEIAKYSPAEAAA